MRFFQRLLQQLKQIWLGMSMARQVGLVLLTAACLAATAGICIWASRPDYRMLFSGLDPEDAGAITAKLQAQSVPYRLEANGTTILVPADQAQQARLKLAMEGLPEKGGKGWDLFDNAPLGTTPMQQQVNYIRAMQVELAKSIMKFEPVALARVHIVRPEPTPFIKEQKPTTASVILKIKPGAALSRGKAAGIQSFVARSVEGLLPENVAILDTTGRVLSDNRNASQMEGQVSTQLEYQRELESYLSSKAEDMLGLALGPGRAVIRVTASINFKKTEETKETYNNDDKAVLEEVLRNNKETGAGPSAGGVAGTGSNLKKPGPTPGPPESKKQEENITTKYAVSKVIQKFEDRFGNIERISVAAMVDLSGVDGKPTPGAPGMDLKGIENLVKQAVGFKTGRDQIAVTNVKLVGAAPAAGMEAEWVETQRWQNYIQLARNASLGIAALAALGIAWLVIRRLRSRETGARTTTEKPERERILKEITAVQRDPDAVARVLAAWLAEKEEKGKIAA
jgi:flagellar M-ring protein FliF